MGRPFVKWAGGKTQLLDELKSKMPLEYGTYFEPMVGGGALFFELAPANAVLVDANFELIRLYSVIRDDVENLIDDLQRHENTSEYYYALRALDRTDEFDEQTDAQKASRTLFLNRTCFNGLHRVNSRGQFNVPYGRYVSPYIPDAGHLRNCSEVLQGCVVACQHFSWIRNRVQEGDFIYLDPPYMPLSETSKFTNYTTNGFGMDEHIVLRDFCRELTERGVRFMLSNSHTPATLDLYGAGFDGFDISTLIARRSISARSAGRRPVREIIVRNYS